MTSIGSIRNIAEKILSFRDYENKTKIVSHNKDNIHNKLNFVKHVTPTTAFEMKDHLNNIFLNPISSIRPKSTFNVHEKNKRNINFEEINKNHFVIKQIISDSKVVKNRIYKLE